MIYHINTENLREYIPKLKAKDEVYLTGIIYTARDAAHEKLVNLIGKDSFPFDLKDSIIYYAGPTPSKDDEQIGSCGPTTSGRMDAFTPVLIENGLLGIIGKGERNKAVKDGIYKNGCVYFCAIGGAGALAAESIVKYEEIAFSELGCESVKKLWVKDFYTIVAYANGTDIYDV